MSLKVKPILLPKPQLQQVVVEGLLADANFGGCLLQTVPDELALAKDAVVKLAPEGNFLDDVGDGTFFCALGVLALQGTEW